MKRLLLSLFTILVYFQTNAQIEIPRVSPNVKVQQKIGLSDFSLDYSRPGVKNREIFGNLVPFGQIWRTGANENTKITFDTELSFGDTKVKAGTYSVYTIPNKDSWELIFYSDFNNWGNPTNWDETKVVARVKSQPLILPYTVETLTLDFNSLSENGGVFEIIWEKTYVPFKFTIETDKKVMQSIDKSLAGPEANDFYAAAVYYKNANKDIKKAIMWIDKAIEMTKDNPNYWFYRQKALIYAKSGDKREAIKAAKTSLKLAEQAGNQEYVKMNEDSIKEWN